MANAEKRSVSTDALETLGTIIDESAGRDAIHLAVEPVIAGMVLHAGEDVGLSDGLAYTLSRKSVKEVGIVDPFLKSPVQKGERFWLVVYPRQITSLRHVWSHPAFPDPAVPVKPEDKAASEAWLRTFFGSIYCDYDRGMEYTEEYISEGGGSINFGTGDSGDIPSEFWSHIETVTGRRAEHRTDWFTCAC